ncbi:MAG: hypothetical protein WBX25_32030 [Rhodomicrobium sp.]
MTENTIRIYKRKKEAGEIIGWPASIKIPSSSNMWGDVRHRSMPADFYGSIFSTKEAAIEAAKAELRAGPG